MNRLPGVAIAICASICLAPGARAGGVPASERIARAVQATLPAGLAVGQVRAPELPPGEVTVEWTAQGARPGWVNVMTRVRAGGAERGRAWARVELRPLRTVAVAARPLRAGESVLAGDVATEERAVAASPFEAGRPATGSPVGARLRRDVAAGELLLESDLVRPAPLPRGTAVKVVLRRGSVTVSAAGTLERPARPGELAAARLTSAGHLVQGQLLDERTLLAEGDAP